MFNKLNIIISIKLFFHGLFKITKKSKQDFFKSSWSIFLVIISLFFINLLIYLFYPNNSEALQIAAEKIIDPLHHFRISPEPIENIQALTSLILTPLIIIFGIKIFSSKLFTRVSISNYIYFFNLALYTSLIGILFYFSFKIDDPNFIEGVPGYFKIMKSEMRFLVAIAIYPLITYFIINGIPKKYHRFVKIILYSFLSITLLSIFLLSTFNRDSYIGAYDHLNAVIFSVSEVQQGKTLLVDFTNQYGLYPHFLYPIFKLINLNIVNFSLVMSALTTISYSLIFLGLRKIINNNLVTLLAFSTIIFFSFIALFVGPFDINVGAYDIYPAYKPIRMIFPALILYSVFTYILSPKRNLYLLIIFISSLSILWNFDSGVICFLSFYIYILYESLLVNNLKEFTKKFIKHTFISLSVLILTIFLFSSFIYFRSNSFPDWTLFLSIVNNFGKSNFLSLPMSLFKAWNLIFLVYLYGIYIGLNSVLLGKKDAIDKIAFFVSIFGLGISTYYLNRSHDSNLLQILYPSIILLAIFLSKLLHKNNRADLFQIKNLSIVMMISFILVISSFQILQPNKIIHELSSRIPNIINNKLTNQLASNGLELLKLNTRPGDQVAIFSDIDAVLYVESKTTSPFTREISSVISRFGKKKYMDSLNNNKSYNVFISDNVFRTGKTPDIRHVEIMKILHKYYYLDDWFGGWRMFKPNAYKEVTQSKIKPSATYAEFCKKTSLGCSKLIESFSSIENFPTDTKLIKIDIDLPEEITIQSIMLHIIIDSYYQGTLSTLPIDHLTNIGILDSKNQQLINTFKRLDDIDYRAYKRFSIVIPDRNYLNACPTFKIELTSNNKNITLRAPCK